MIVVEEQLCGAILHMFVSQHITCASAAHFLQCTALADLRVPFEEQIYQTFMSGAANQMSKLDTPLTKQEVLQNILHVQPV